jgi:hypothetical protein
MLLVFGVSIFLRRHLAALARQRGLSD